MDKTLTYVFGIADSSLKGFLTLSCLIFLSFVILNLWVVCYLFLCCFFSTLIFCCDFFGWIAHLLSWTLAFFHKLFFLINDSSMYSNSDL